MRVVADIETDGLNPTKIWVVSALDIDTGQIHDFIRPDIDPGPLETFAKQVSVWIFHNGLAFDIPVLNDLCPSVHIDQDSVIDTLVVGRLCNFLREEGHSLESYGVSLGIPKVHYEDWNIYDERILERVHSDLSITYGVYNIYKDYIYSPLWTKALRVEHNLAKYLVLANRHGFYFYIDKARELLLEISKERDLLLSELQEVFPPIQKLVKEFTPKATKFNTISKSSVPKHLRDQIHTFEIGKTYPVYETEVFNPGSPKQRIDRLWEAGWRPITKTKGHLKFLKERNKDLEKLSYFQRYGWVTNEENLSTLPEDAPEGIKKLVRWLLLAARCGDIEEWINACGTDSRIHGTINPIGAWTHRCSHTSPNLGNIAKYNEKQPHLTPYSDRMRALFGTPEGRLIVGVDADSIQLRILAHYIDDQEFTFSLTQGKKEDGTDPHSVNQRALGYPCKSRDAAKTFIYAWILGAGVDRVKEILDCSREEAKEAGINFLTRYPGLAILKEEIIREDAERGYFKALDGRYIQIKGDSVSSKSHFCLGGYLQSGEKIVMAHAMDIWAPRLTKERVPFWLVNFVHDEWQTETVNDLDTAKYIAEIQAESIKLAGENLGVRCPLAGSIMNSHGKLAIGRNWMETH